MLVKAHEEGMEEGRAVEREARVAAERRAEEEAEAHRQEAEARRLDAEARRQEAEARETAEAELREAMAEIQRLKGTSPSD